MTHLGLSTDSMQTLSQLYHWSYSQPQCAHQASSSASCSYLQAPLCSHHPAAALPAAERQDIVYVGNRIRQKGESNGKACNLNNTLRNLYPPGQPVDPNEVGWGGINAVKHQALQLFSMSCA